MVLMLALGATLNAQQGFLEYYTTTNATQYNETVEKFAEEMNFDYVMYFYNQDAGELNADEYSRQRIRHDDIYFRPAGKLNGKWIATKPHRISDLLDPAYYYLYLNRNTFDNDILIHSDFEYFTTDVYLNITITPNQKCYGTDMTLILSEDIAGYKNVERRLITRAYGHKYLGNKLSYSIQWDDGWDIENCKFQIVFEDDDTVIDYISVSVMATVMTNIHDIPLNETIKVYPNPFKNEIKVISGDLMSSIDVYGMNGQLIKKVSKIGSKEALIDSSSFPGGIYFLIINGDTVSKKIVKL